MVLAPPVETQIMTLTRTIHAPVDQVYNAFLSRDTLYYWLCDDACVRGEVGGYLLLSWANPPTFVTGKFTALEKNQYIAFTWREPDREETEVEVEIEESDGGIKIVLRHSGNFEDETPHEKRWQKWLDNLVSFLETGAALRISHRVIIGIFPDALNKGKAQRLGLPVTDGTLVSGFVLGSSAEKAGLQPDDAIVAMNRQPVTALERKSNLWWMVFELHGFPTHIRNHFKQIQEAVQAARAAQLLASSQEQIGPMPLR